MTQKDWGKKIGENRGVGVGEAWKEYKDRNEENTLRKSVWLKRLRKKWRKNYYVIY